MAGQARAVATTGRKTVDEDDRNLSAFRPIRLPKAADAVVAVLADAIRGGLYGPGDLLPRERDLADRLEVSRSVVREAIDVLRRAGVVSVRRGPSGGTTIVSPETVRQVVANLRGPTHDAMAHVAEVRRLLESSVALYAAERASDEELATLIPMVEGLPQLLGQPDEFFELDVRFHEALGRLTHNPVLAEHYSAVIDRMREVRQQFPVLVVALPQALANQRRLHDAVRSRDRERILRATEEHLRAFEEAWFLPAEAVTNRP
jgi:GntR family transcriptional repressor for pyruvate dehydrogenase complex